MYLNKYKYKYVVQNDLGDVLRILNDKNNRLDDKHTINLIQIVAKDNWFYGVFTIDEV